MFQSPREPRQWSARPARPPQRLRRFEEKGPDARRPGRSSNVTTRRGGLLARESLVALAIGLLEVVCVRLFAVAPQQTPPAGDNAVAHVRLLLEQGAYAAAEREATDLATRVEAGGSIDASSLPGYLLDLLVETRVANGKAGDNATFDLAQRAVGAARTGTGDNADVATSLHNLGDLHFERGEF